MIPALEELKPLKQWVVWQTEERQAADGTMKETKVPIDPHTGRYASSTDPSTWGTYEEARAGYRRYGGSGLGFVFTRQGGIVGVDLDNCITANGSISQQAQAIIQRLNSYTEYSPSQQGLHILVRGAVPQAVKRDNDGIEIYNEARYFTITGQHLEGTPNTLEFRPAEILDLYQEYAPKTERKVQSTVQVYDSPDAERIREALNHIPKKQHYDDWIRCLMAVHSVMPGQQGVALIEEWSPGYDGEVERKFKSFDRTPRNDVTIGTLFYIAGQHGWKPETTASNDELDSVDPPLTEVQKAQVQQVVTRLNEQEYWRGFHDGMTEAQKQIWERLLPAGAADLFELGYRARTVDTDTGEIQAAALTVPYFDPKGNVLNIEYRYVDECLFDYETTVTAPLYMVDGEREVKGPALLIDDSIEAMWYWLHYGEEILRTLGSQPPVVMATPKIRLNQESYTVLENCEPIYVVAAHDTHLVKRDLAPIADRARVFRLSEPLRGLLSDITVKEFDWYLKQARALN